MLTNRLITPQWRSAASLCESIHPFERDWLFNEDSLTRRLTRLSGNAFSVTPLHERWEVLRDDECDELGLPAGSEGRVREVLLRGHDVPWVFARSVAGRDALLGDGLDLESLGSRSLGELLFSDQAFTRGPFQACHFPAQWLPASIREDQLWARRSCFSRGNLGVLVAEVFLPTVWQAINRNAPATEAR